MGELFDKLKELEYENILPMHMPGAKRSSRLIDIPDAVKMDITEVAGFDNLHHATGVIKDVAERAAALYGADEAYLLVNGSSVGLMAAICGATRHGDEVLVARNVHRSVINSLYMGRLNASYVYPQMLSVEAGIYGAVSADDIEAVLSRRNSDAGCADGGVQAGYENDDSKMSREREADCRPKRISAVVITSPTYEGIVSDISAIAQVVHRYGAVLIVDEAHGAHFGMHEAFPQNAVAQGTDAVVMSLHKTLPSLTQTALLTVNTGRIDIRRIRLYWDMLQSTSPSYLLMGSIDNCISLMENSRDELFDEYVSRLTKLICEIRKLKHIKLMQTDDISKLVLIVRDGTAFAGQLRDIYKIEPEMASAHYIIAMTSIGDTDEGYVRFLQALRNLDTEENDIACANGRRINLARCDAAARLSCPKISIFEALDSETEDVHIRESVGRIAGEALCIYPPGINLVNPGEIITDEAVEALCGGMDSGLEVMGVDESQTVRCLKKL